MLMPSRAWFSTIRVRLTAALAGALFPVLILGAVQSGMAFHRESEARRETLAAAAERAASTARARMDAAEILLETLGPGSVGLQCAQRLAQITDRIPGYNNLIRFDRDGRVACAARSVPLDLQRVHRPWFETLRNTDKLLVTRDPGATYASAPALLAAVRAEDGTKAFDGVMVAVIDLKSLAPRLNDPSLPSNSEIALVDGEGRMVSSTNAAAFGQLPPRWRQEVRKRGSRVWYADDLRGKHRVYSISALAGDGLFVLMGAKSGRFFSLGQLNPLIGLAFPLLTFGLALMAVVIATDRVVIRWISYLQRISAIYARGKMTVRPVHAGSAPAEIRALAGSMEEMARAIQGRDASLRDSLAEKDTLMREIHHRVKNNLQVISSLINLQQRALKDAAARTALSDTRQRISALALIYRALYQGPSLRQVDLRTFLEDLTGQLIVGEGVSGANVETVLEVDTLVIDADRLAPLALFAVEAISNARKHALAERGGRLSVSFKVEGGQAALSISDDGQAPDEAMMATGVGRTLMNAFGRQLRGQVELTRNASGGLTARLAFPLASPSSASKPRFERRAAA